MAADQFNQPTVKGRLQGMLDRAWNATSPNRGWPKGFDTIKQLSFGGNSPGDGAALWVNSLLWHHYKTYDGPTFAPKVVKVWAWGWDYLGVTGTPFGRDRTGDVDLMVGDEGKARKIKVTVNPISSNTYQTAIIEYFNGQAHPVRAIWASTNSSGTEWRYTLSMRGPNPYQPQ